VQPLLRLVNEGLVRREVHALLLAQQLLQRLRFEVDVDAGGDDCENATSVSDLGSLPAVALNKRVRHDQELFLSRILREFRDLSGNKIDFEFENVFVDKTDKEKSEIIKQLSGKGVMYYNDIEMDADQQKRNLILPAAEVSYGADKEYVINLLNTEFGRAEETSINKSIEGLEYEIANVIRKCINKEPKKIAFLYGHGEPEAVQMDDLLNSLSENLSIDRLFFNLGDENFLSQFVYLTEKTQNYDSLGKMIVAKTLEKFKEYDARLKASYATLPERPNMLHKGLIR
jgi:hypothetical protein